MTNIDWSKISNPFLDIEPQISTRDPLLVFHDDIFRCFYSAVELKEENYTFYLDCVESRDLVNWSGPRRLIQSDRGFSSPGSVMRVGDEWVMSLQTYPVPPGENFASDQARLWIMRSRDLVDWGDPVCINPQGAKVAWTSSHRQIDPCITEYDGRYWCFYKAGGVLGMLVSNDLEHWEEAQPQRPVLGKEDTPDGEGMENPSVIRDGDEFVLFFTRCNYQRKIGTARSRDLLNWRDVRYLPFPELPWAPNGPSAAQVSDLRGVCGKYVMLFHGERCHIHEHSAVLGIAWSDDLENWTIPNSLP